MLGSFVRNGVIVAGMLTLGSGVATAQTMSFSDYQGAIIAAEMCKKMKHSPADYQKLNAAIAKKSAGSEGPGMQLMALEKARDDVRAAAGVSGGCAGEPMKKRLSVYDALKKDAM
ncbi:MAG: hypothetical protein JNK11_04610 [Alphaproteobacteria bacterium]|nr:hypothetical protein [Alphaproteobacteria bacterium]